MLGALIPIAIKVALWTGAVMAVASAGYTAYDVAQGFVEAADGARRSSRAARDAAEEFARPGSGAGLDELQQDYTEGQLAQHRGIGRVSSTLTQNLLTSVGPFSGDSENTFSTDTLTTLAQLPDTFGGGSSSSSGSSGSNSGGSGSNSSAPAPNPSSGTSDGTYLGRTEGYESYLRGGQIAVNEVEIKVFDDILTFSFLFVLENEGIGYVNDTVVCSVNIEAVVESTPMSLPAGGAFRDSIRWNYRFYDWTGDCDDDSRDQDAYEDFEVSGHVLDGGRVEGEILLPDGGGTFLTFTAEQQ
jgi:hypothetical protein